MDNQTPDAAARLWTSIELAHQNFAANRRELGKLFFQLRNLYSERANSAARRLSPGHGVFQAEIKRHGYRPNRVREWVNDHEVEIGLRPPAESTAAKRKARREPSAEYSRGYRAAVNDFPTVARDGSDPISRFANLLPYAALKSAYRTALKELHPDHGGCEERTKALISAWKEVEEERSSVESEDTRGFARVN